METRANYVIVGIFTVVAVLAAFGFVYWIARFGETGDTAMLRFRIPGSASGLGRGSSVLFNGVKVGSVDRVYIDPKNPTVAIADTQVDAKTPVTQSTVADVGIAGLTGQANIELRGGNPAECGECARSQRRHVVRVIVARSQAPCGIVTGDDGGEVDEARDMDEAPVVENDEAAEMLEPAEAPFDAVATRPNPWPARRSWSWTGRVNAPGRVTSTNVNRCQFCIAPSR